MESRINDGGPAFPIPPIDNGPGNIKTRPEPGMSLRDWFAGQMLSGIMAGSASVGIVGNLGDAYTVERTKHVARACYAVADAMLAVREAA